MPLVSPACHCTDEVDDEANALNVAEGDTESQRDVGEDADVTAVDDAGDAGDAEDIGPDDTGPQDTGADDAGDVKDTGEGECGEYFDECERIEDCCEGLICSSWNGKCMIGD